MCRRTPAELSTHYRAMSSAAQPNPQHTCSITLCIRYRWLSAHSLVPLPVPARLGYVFVTDGTGCMEYTHGFQCPLFRERVKRSISCVFEYIWLWIHRTLLFLTFPAHTIVCCICFLRIYTIVQNKLAYKNI